MDLNMKVEDLFFSPKILKELRSIGINILRDFDSYSLSDLKYLLNEEILKDIIPILKNIFLPSSLENLNLSQDLINIFKNNKIYNLRSLLETDENFLKKLIVKNSFFADQIKNIFSFYQYKNLNFHDIIDIKNKKNSIINSNKEYGSREYDYFKIRLASSHEIRQWSYGEIVNYETINYRTAKPEIGGLFCPKIFGPVKDLQCFCSKKTTLRKGQICLKCGVEITEQKVRRERMGHIELASPIVHTWYLNSSPSRLAILLGIKAKELSEIVYYASYIVFDPGKTNLEKKQIISEIQYGQYLEHYGNNFIALTGAEAIKTMLEELNLNEIISELRIFLKKVSKQKRDNIIKRLEIIESFNKSDNKPEWMVMDVIPVLPADLRPIVPLDGGRFATTDINDLYRRILNRNNRLKKQIKQKAPRLIIKNEKRMLQEAVDALFDNAKTSKKNNSNIERNKNLKSLSEMLRGKQGRFRQNLLGKRVDYSGRSVIIVGPDLKIHQCGIPRQMAFILFKPFILNKLQEVKGIDRKNATILYEKMNEYVLSILEEVVKEHPVLLNRAPTLHRLGIQAFEPKLIDGKAIRLHPLVTPAFNADFDGDQMAVYLPLSIEAQAEARLLMLVSNNILDPKNGSPVLSPSQDMVLGNYYLTIEKSKYFISECFNCKKEEITDLEYKHRNEGKFFFDLKEAELAFYNKEIELHTRILVKASNIDSNFTDEQNKKYLITTLGKLIFNRILPSNFNYIQEPTIFNLETKTPDIYFIPKNGNPKDFLPKVPITEPFKKKFVSMIIDYVFKKSNITETSKMLDNIKDLGFKYSTIAGITISHFDINVYSKKKELLIEVENKISEIEKWYDNGFLTISEKKSLVIKEWKIVRDKIQDGLMQEFDKNNHLFMISDSGARGNASNFSQLSGMRGLMNSPKGEILEIPVKSSFKEGLTVSEFFISTHGARKVSTDTALKTAESGYLTRRLVDVAQDNIIMKEECGSDKGIFIEAIVRDEKEIISLEQRIFGRFSAENIINPVTQELILNKNELITKEIISKIIESNIKKVKIRSVLNCNFDHGICSRCYGLNLATNKNVEIGEAVGVIAAQSIGEPGTQLTMRTFHTGGVLAVSDITQGLPRIQELFEARKPKGKSVISECNGFVKDIKNINSNFYEIKIVSDEDNKKEFVYNVLINSEILVHKNIHVKAGQKLTNGSIDLRELLRITNVEETQKYILEEVQKVYQSQSVFISDKHIEIIIRQMFKQVLIIYEGDTDLLPGLEVSIKDFRKENMKMIKNNKSLAVARPILLGITRASLKSDSLLSAASFQETTKILIDAAIKGQIDYLYGLKENVIVGGLIPAGTGILETLSFKYPKNKISENI
ncbi:DNA-directed RNA polymerase subunit beta' [Candidatus Phytoplasma sacchari]|uniref:DNA-directed RNA polymerase subunit beta' n=1 Tax=Candidatus Phytoplasma sacchari TaxID=2609813 RepID=A0ABY7M0M0_9MOLU|nr:DNA-directed RNA polymerase subunit beta' [Candidatus Phytoplasma sacchari]